MLGGVLSKVPYAVLVFKLAGLGLFFRQLKRTIYSRTTYDALEKNLDTDIVPVPSKIGYYLRLASADDMEEALQKAKLEDKESAYELVQRKWFYDAGFHNCYVGRTVDTNELCFLQWLISSEDFNLVSHGFRNRYYRLKEDEALFDNGFTFAKYRGKGILPSAHAQMFEMAKKKGFKRVMAYVRQDNIASLKGSEKGGFRKFEEIHELKLLFFTRRKDYRGFNDDTWLASYPRGDI